MAIIRAQDREGSSVKGEDYDASISLILDESQPGQGPRLHRHDYDETWVVVEGNVTFQAGEERHTVGPGDIVVVPPRVPHKFTNDGPGQSKLVCIHASPTIVGEWLE